MFNNILRAFGDIVSMATSDISAAVDVNVRTMKSVSVCFN